MCHLFTFNLYIDIIIVCECVFITMIIIIILFICIYRYYNCVARIRYKILFNSDKGYLRSFIHFTFKRCMKYVKNRILENADLWKNFLVQKYGWFSKMHH